jgi:hypothetical protein
MGVRVWTDTICFRIVTGERSREFGSECSGFVKGLEFTEWLLASRERFCSVTLITSVIRYNKINNIVRKRAVLYS